MNTHMSSEHEKTAVLDEGVWRAWVQKGKRRQLARAQLRTTVGGIVLVLLIVVAAFYVFA